MDMTNKNGKAECPVVSMVMPVYGRADEVRVMLDSVLANTLQDWELLVVDDGSDEDTLQMLMSYEQKDARIRLLRRTELPKGAQTCRNMGMDAARGEYIFFADSDDVISPTCLETRVEQMRQHPELDFMVFPLCALGEGVLPAEDYIHSYGYPIYDDDLKALVRGQLPFVVCTNLYRLQSLKDHGLRWDTHLRSKQDADFNVAAFLSGLRYAYAACPPDYYYRLPQQRTSGSSIVTAMFVRQEQKDSHLYLLDKLYRSLRASHGHRYDGAVLELATSLVNAVLSRGYDMAFASRVTALVSSYDRMSGLRLRLQCAACRMLHPLSPSLALKVGLLSYYIQYRRFRKDKQQRIASLIAERTNLKTQA